MMVCTRRLMLDGGCCWSETEALSLRWMGVEVGGILVEVGTLL